MVVGGDAGEVIRGKLGQGGCTIKKTASAIVIGIYAEGVQPGDCNVIVENLGDYLMQQGIWFLVGTPFPKQRCISWLMNIRLDLARKCQI